MKKFLIILVLVLSLISCQQRRVEKQTEHIEYFVETPLIKEDEQLLVGQTKIISQKVAGIKEITKEVTYENNKEISSQIISEKVIKEAQPEIVASGIREVKLRKERIQEPKFEIIKEDDPNLEMNQEVIIQEGTNGETEITYEDVYIKSKLIETKELNKSITSEPINQIISVGTKEVIDYSTIPNDDLSWWYQPGPPSTISQDVQNIISNHHVYWQMDSTKPVIYLTMDEGYEFNNNTISILDTLKEKNVKITFFITGSYYDNNPELVNRMINEGHQVANHTIHHYRAAPTLDESLEKYVSDIKDLETKVPNLVKLHRPPEGGYSQRSLQIIDDLGYTTVFWSFAYRDWLTDDQPDPETAKSTILNNLHNGSIILIHAVSNTNTEILGDVIDSIQELGYDIELLPTP